MKKSFSEQFDEASIESFSGQNEAEEVAKDLLTKADEKIAKFERFFKAIDMSEPDSVGYAMRDSNTTYTDFE